MCVGKEWGKKGRLAGGWNKREREREGGNEEGLRVMLKKRMKARSR